MLLLSGCAGHPVIQQQAADWQPNISSPQFVLNVLHWLSGPLPD